jgi:hypothetical protein
VTLASIRTGYNVEIIVADGGKDERTRAAARAHGARVLRSAPGWAQQLNDGAARAKGELLLFLHAGVRLPAGYDLTLRQLLSQPGTALGAFPLRIVADRTLPHGFAGWADRSVWWLRLLNGECVVGVRAETFHRLGGFAAKPKRSTPRPLVVASLCLLLTILQPGSAQPRSFPVANALLQFTAAQRYVVAFGIRSMIVAARQHMLKVELVGARDLAPVSQAGSALTNLRGPAQPLQRVTYPEAWPGVTVEYQADTRGIVKSSYHIRSGLNRGTLDQIRIRYNRPVRLDAQGNLILRFKQGEMIEAAPKAWQEIGGRQRAVAAAYRIFNQHEVGFTAEYDPRYPLVIDPTLMWNTFQGGSDHDAVNGIALDAGGNVYVTGVQLGHLGNADTGLQHAHGGFYRQARQHRGSALEHVSRRRRE